jgi:uncharacterized cupin superfamily protein
MTDAKITALSADAIAEVSGSRYPSPFDVPCQTRSNRRLGDAFGLTHFGVNLLILAPGTWSSQRHWHTHEDEFIYVLEGNPTLITDQGETRLSPGDCAGFRAGVSDGHQIVNNGSATAKLLVVGARNPDDDVYYSDIDMRILAATGRFEHRNGDPYE